MRRTACASPAGAAAAQPALPPEFVRWWFAPWELAAGTPEALPLPARDLLGRRDAYRHWCAAAGIAAALPAAADPRWTPLAWLDDDALLDTARLFGGLFAARTPMPAVLAGLAPEERRWCAGVASLQPLPRAPWPAATGRDASLVATGLAWLALCLENGFPGLWPRLRLRLAPALDAAVERCLLERAGPIPEAALARVARCWNLCLLRAGAPTTPSY